MSIFKDDLNTAKCLKLAMFEKQIKGKDLAKTTGRNPSEISRWRGDKIPENHIYNLAKALGYTREEFLKLGE